MFYPLVSRTGHADDTIDITVVDRERHIFQCLHGAVGCAEGFTQTFDLNHITSSVRPARTACQHTCRAAQHGSPRWKPDLLRFSR